MVASTAAASATTATAVVANNNNNNSKRDAFIADDVPVNNNNNSIYDNYGALFNRRMAEKSNVVCEGIFKIFAEGKATETRTLFSAACCNIISNNNIGNNNNNNYPSFTFISGALSSSVSACTFTYYDASGVNFNNILRARFLYESAFFTKT